MRAVRRAEEPFRTVEVVRQVLEARGEMPGSSGKAFRSEVYLSEVPLAINPGGRIVRKGKPSEWERDDRRLRRSDLQKQRATKEAGGDVSHTLTPLNIRLFYGVQQGWRSGGCL